MIQNKIFGFLLPKSSNFFPLFIKGADNLVVASGKLVDLLGTADYPDRQVLISQMKEIQHNGDIYNLAVLKELNLNFITPFDKEDIHALANAIHEVVDCIYTTSRRIHSYRLFAVPEEIFQIADLIHDSSKEIQKVLRTVKTLNDFKVHVGSIRNISEMEQQVDDIYQSFLSKLFDQEADAIELFKKRDILINLEKTIDKCDEVGKIFSGLIVKMG